LILSHRCLRTCSLFFNLCFLRCLSSCSWILSSVCSNTPLKSPSELFVSFTAIFSSRISFWFLFKSSSLFSLRSYYFLLSPHILLIS
jgi:hypothetical protein